MKLYSENDSYKIYNGDMLDMLQVIKPESIDAIVCDPPYELGFMNKSWDSTGIAFKKETWQNCFEVLKPGGYLLAFGGSRTYHRIACAIEDAGFEIRDCIMYLYGCGFSKSYNIGLAIDKKNGVESEVVGVGKSGCNSRAYQSEKPTTAGNYDIKKSQNEWQGWGTCLKPAYEPIIVARKPFKGSVVDNIIKYRVGGLNIDECRVGNEHFEIKNGDYDNNQNQRCYGNVKRTQKEYYGRFPSNVITDGCIRANVETARKFGANSALRKNIHPTCKPTELMQYLVRLVSPKGATILDPFMGSGSTGKAVMFENRERDANYKFIGIELTEEYLPIAQARI